MRTVHRYASCSLAPCLAERHYPLRTNSMRQGVYFPPYTYRIWSRKGRKILRDDMLAAVNVMVYR
jgi:hypothetical protein